MPIEVEQKKLRISYIYINLYTTFLAIMPLIVLIKVVNLFITFNLLELIDIAFISTIFILFARFFFMKHREINNIFLGHYHGADKARLAMLFNLPPSIIERVYDKMPLPLINLQRLARGNNWRAR